MLTADQLQRFDEDGFVVVPDVLDADEASELLHAAWENFPAPEQYFADPESFAHLVATPFSGLANFPWVSPRLNRLAAHPRILAIVRQILGVDDIRLYKGELWAKYGGATDYDQHHHRDFGNHTLVVPTLTARRWMQVTTFTYLCDVDESNGATAAVPKQHSANIPMGERRTQPGDLRDCEVLAAGAAGSTLFYSTEVFHRATAIKDPTASRFTVLLDYKSADNSWTNKHAFGHLGQKREMIEFVTNVDPDTRTLLDIPAPGHPYWTTQTIADMEVRYPGIDMEPYRAVL
jgi:ectoine hydroxylase-related dioxygenase (phytanoyl-CoA dioxygenase family)